MALEAGQIEEFRERFEGLSTDPDLQANVDERDLQRLREDDKYVLCFVHWKKGNIEEATKLAAQVLTWRKERRVNDLRAEDIGEPLMKRGIMFVHGRALDDTRVVYFISRLQTKEIKTQVQAIMCLWMERLQRLETGKHVTFLLDVSKASMANVDLGGIKFLLECFTTYFPDMLERIIILEMPWIMNAIWKVVKQWMTEEQRRRTIFCKFKELKEYISQDQLPQYMGGADTWEYIFPLRPTDYPQLKETTQTAQSSTNSMESLHENDEVSNNEEDKMMPPSDKVSSTRDKIFTTSDEASTSHLRATPNIQSPQDEESLPNGRLATEQELDRVPSNSILTSSTTNSSKASLDQSESKRRNTPSRHSSFTSEIDREESYKSFTGFDGSMNMQQNSKASARDVTSEVRLGSLLFMSPISELSFREDRRDGGSGRCQSIVTLRNPNQDQLVAFKFKTNSPERYHVRPSNGVVTPGETTTVVINLSPGYEESASSDRFLVLYQKIDAAADVHEFWSQHTAKDSRFVHRLRVRFIRSTKVEKIATPVLKKPMLPPVTKKAPFTSTEVTQMTREISLLKTKLAQAEVNTRWLRTKFQYSMILQIILTLLLLFALHQLSSLASLVELGRQLSAFFYFACFGRTSQISMVWQDQRLPENRPIIIGHRGSSGMLPGHTVAAYQLAIDQGADVIECDLAVTKDLLLVCTHEPWLNLTTDVAARPEFQDRLRTYAVPDWDGTRIVRDFFTVDFTLDELKTLRKVQRFSYRDQAYNGEFPIATFDEYVAVAKNVTNGRTIGIYPELKVPKFFNSILAAHNTTMEEILLESLQRHGYTEATSPCFVQSFDEDSLRFMSGRTELPLMIITKLNYSDGKMAELSKFCHGLIVLKNLIVEVDHKTNDVIGTTNLIKRAHLNNLKVHSFTFQNEFQFLAWQYGADPYREYDKFVPLGVDGFFTDYPWTLSNYFKREPSL